MRLFLHLILFAAVLSQHLGKRKWKAAGLFQATQPVYQDRAAASPSPFREVDNYNYTDETTPRPVEPAAPVTADNFEKEDAVVVQNQEPALDNYTTPHNFDFFENTTDQMANTTASIKKTEWTKLNLPAEWWMEISFKFPGKKVDY
jgi:hypothetical protein